jgi:hypothetical protein
MLMEDPSPFVHLSRDVIFSREVLCGHGKEEPFSLSGGSVRRAPRSARRTAPGNTMRRDAAPAEQPSLF